MTDIEALKTLLERVEAGPRPGVLALDGIAATVFPYSEFVDAIEAYGGSLDTALALHNAVLPGWGWAVEIDEATVWHPETYGISRDIDHAETPARAWLIAIIKAKIAELEE